MGRQNALLLAALELAPKAQVLEGQGIKGHFKIYSLGNGVSRSICHCGLPIVSSEYAQDWEQCRGHVPGVPRHRLIRTFHRSKPVSICVQCHSKLQNGCFTILSDGVYFSLAVMVEGDETGWLRMAD